MSKGKQVIEAGDFEPSHKMGKFKCWVLKFIVKFNFTKARKF